MPRTARPTPGGYAHHVLNRGVNRMTIFEDDDDYHAFERSLARCLDLHPGVRLLTYCLMPTHWHLLLWPRGDDDLSPFMQRLTLTHTRRWQEHRHCHGSGHLYQSRFKSFPIQRDDHFLTVARYVERNALRAKLCRRAEDWPWSGLWIRQFGGEDHRRMLSPWPVREPRNWLALVNREQTDAVEEAIRTSVNRGRPFGGTSWVKRTAAALGLEHTLRPRGRPTKASPL